jgi:hypothetical protein
MTSTVLFHRRFQFSLISMRSGTSFAVFWFADDLRARISVVKMLTFSLFVAHFGLLCD